MDITSGGTPAKVTVTTSSTEIVADKPGRKHTVLVEVFSGGPVFVRSQDSATINDFPLPTGSIFKYAGTAPLNGIVSSGSADVRTWSE